MVIPLEKIDREISTVAMDIDHSSGPTVANHAAGSSNTSAEPNLSSGPDDGGSGSALTKSVNCNNNNNIGSVVG